MDGARRAPMMDGNTGLRSEETDTMGWSLEDCTFQFQEEKALVSADGNNVAWICNCGGPILFVYQSGRRGSGPSSPAPCPKCKAKYFLDPSNGTKKEPPPGKSAPPADIIQLVKNMGPHVTSAPDAPEFAALDFENDYLADVLQMTGDRIAKLQTFIDPLDPEGNGIVRDPMEHIAGMAMVAAQRYISSVCKWLSVPKRRALMLGPKKRTVAVSAIVDAAANYWKHIEDGPDSVYVGTRKVLAKAGVVFESGYCVSNAIHECGYKHLSELLPDLVTWRDEMIQEADNEAKKEIWLIMRCN